MEGSVLCERSVNQSTEPIKRDLSLQMVSLYLTSLHYFDRDFLVEEPNYLARYVSAPSTFVVKDSRRRREHNVTELTRWQELDDPLLKIGNTDVVARGDDAGFVDTI